MKPKISVIIPVYNAENRIKLSIESVLNQSFQNFELILINDGSQDNSKEICESYTKKDKRVLVINQNNQGVSKARNKGLEVAKGKYINFIDSDDTIEVDTFEVLINNIEETNLDMILYGMSFDYYNKGAFSHSNNKTVDHNIKIDLINLKGNFFYLYDSNYLSSSCNKLIKRSILKENDIKFNENMGILEDLNFTLDVFDHILNILAINKPLYKYYNEISVSGFNRRPNIDYIKNFNILDKRLRNTALNIGLESQEDIGKINCMIIRYYITYLELLFYNENSVKTKQNKIKCFLQLEEVIKSSKKAKCKNFKLQIINYLIKKKFKKILFLVFYIHNKIKR